MTRVVMRADAGPHIGSGHVMRCAALAAALRQRGAEVEVVTSGTPGRVAERLQAAGAEVSAPPAVWPDRRDAEATAASARAGQADARWVVVDGYHFDSDYMRTLVDAGLRVAWIDDLNALGRYDCDIVVNPTLGAERMAYDTVPRTRVLAGATYALLRPEFRTVQRAAGAGSNRLVIALGGADPRQLTPAVVRAVLDAGLEDCRLHVVIGPSNPNVDEIRGATAGASSVVVLRDPDDLPDLLAAAGLVITAAGGTSWELASLGVPALLLVVAENQQRGASAMLEAEGAHVVDACTTADLGQLAESVRALWTDRSRRAHMANRGPRLVDGAGAPRVARWMLDGPDASSIVMRAATSEDALQVWRINSEPSVRAQSFDSAAIPLAAHFDWFDRRLAAATSRTYVFARSDEVAAVIRYDRAEGDEAAEISFAVASPFRGIGLGTRVLADSWRTACADLGVGAVRGLVIDANGASSAAFRGAGFAEAGRERRADRACIAFERRAS